MNPGPGSLRPHREEHVYGPHRLQKTAVWKLDENRDETDAEAAAGEEGEGASGSRFWVIYIHGGAWRDPRINATSFQPSVDQLLKSYPAIVSSRVAGFASIDYRLSPHPDFPQDPSSTPQDEYRGAYHPDHIRDVGSALKMLQQEYGFGGRYVLLGHSCGATLALQVLMGLAAAPADEDGRMRRSLLPPAALVGIEGIYDFRGLVKRLGPGYARIFQVPFGTDHTAWDEASPALFKGWAGHAERIVLAWSPDDELVDGQELKIMVDTLQTAGVPCTQYTDLKGTHDEVWKSGNEVARLCASTLQQLP